MCDLFGILRPPEGSKRVPRNDGWIMVAGSYERLTPDLAVTSGWELCVIDDDNPRAHFYFGSDDDVSRLEPIASARPVESAASALRCLLSDPVCGALLNAIGFEVLIDGDL